MIGTMSTMKGRKSARQDRAYDLYDVLSKTGPKRAVAASVLCEYLSVDTQQLSDARHVIKRTLPGMYLYGIPTGKGSELAYGLTDDLRAPEVLIDAQRWGRRATTEVETQALNVDKLTGRSVHRGRAQDARDAVADAVAEVISEHARVAKRGEVVADVIATVTELDAILV